MNARHGSTTVDMLARTWWGLLCVSAPRALLALGTTVEMLMNAETLEFVSLAGVSISREVTSVPAPQDTPRVLTENPVLIRERGTVSSS